MRLRYFCSPYHQDSALYPFVTQLERAAGFARDDTVDEKLGKLQELLAPGTKLAEAVARQGDHRSALTAARDGLEAQEQRGNDDGQQNSIASKASRLSVSIGSKMVRTRLKQRWASRGYSRPDPMSCGHCQLSGLRALFSGPARLERGSMIGEQRSPPTQAAAPPTRQAYHGRLS